MRTFVLLVAGISAAVLVGCVMSPGESVPTNAPSQEMTFGDTPIIRPGMDQDEVDMLLEEHGVGTHVDASTFTPILFSYPSAGLKIVYMDGKVESCRSTTTVVSGPFQRDTISDRTLNQILRPGMTPRDVALKIGPPTFGFENAPGRVVLINGKGVEVTFVDFALTQWRRTTYSAESIK